MRALEFGEAGIDGLPPLGQQQGGGHVVVVVDRLQAGIPRGSTTWTRFPADSKRSAPDGPGANIDWIWSGPTRPGSPTRSPHPRTTNRSYNSPHRNATGTAVTASRVAAKSTAGGAKSSRTALPAKATATGRSAPAAEPNDNNTMRRPRAVAPRRRRTNIAATMKPSTAQQMSVVERETRRKVARHSPC